MLVGLRGSDPTSRREDHLLRFRFAHPRPRRDHPAPTWLPQGPDRRGRIDHDLLARVSPALMEHVNPYGTYEFPVAAKFARQRFCPLRDHTDG